MVKASNGKTTQSSRRHAFSSFRERIDSIKIEPNLSLNKRAHDYVDSSHFLATLEHWKEVNISGNFTEFLDKVENICQTLPQILHHQVTIFDALYTHIEINDINSIQPLLECLSQFIHDLGPDFMPYYDRTLTLLTNLALSTNPNDSQNNRNSSNVLEWCFSSLAFAFKYLSKTLVEDLLPTFKILIPLLQLNKKTYISRFCAEALSFLIRKLKVDSLTSVIEYSFNQQSEIIHENGSYCESLVVLYSESMKNTKGSFHSKSTNILSKLIENSLSNKSSEAKFISIVCDILLDVVNHGTIESCDKFYKLVTIYLTQVLNESTISDTLAISIAQILSTLSFAESGKKISSWSPILSTSDLLIKRVTSKTLTVNQFSNAFFDSLTYLLIIIIRNCEIQELTKYYKTFFETMIELNKGQHFLSFAEANLEISTTKVLNFGIAKYIQDFINSIAYNDSEVQKLGFFLSRLSKKEFYGIDLSIPQHMQVHIISQLRDSYQKISRAEDLPEIYWKLLILKYCGRSSASESQTLIMLLRQLCDKHFSFDSKFSHDVAGCIVDALSLLLRENEDNEIALNVFKLIISNFKNLSESSVFILSVKNFISCCSSIISPLIKDNYDSLVSHLAVNMSFPSHESRYNAILLLIEVHEVLKIEISPIIPQIRLIEEIPLTLNTGRDIELRVRNLALEFKLLDNPNDLECNLISRFMFGLLTNKFQPCWTSVFEALPYLVDKCSSSIWLLAYQLIKMNFGEQNTTYYDFESSAFEEENLLLNWQVRNPRLRGNFLFVDGNFLSKYHHIRSLILDYAESSRADNTYSSILRSHAIHALSSVPSIAESHSDKLVPIVLHETDDEDNDDSNEDSSESDYINQNSWTLKDRNDLVCLFTKFNSLKKVYKADLLYEHMLKLLCNKQTRVQKMALDVILHWKIGSVNKYKDNLKNLLDDTIFRDELSKFISNSSASTIEQSDKDSLMPLVLRILFGRAQSVPKSNSKAGRKFAIVGILPNLSHEYIIEFLKLGSDRLHYQEYFVDKQLPVFDIKVLRKISGFVNLLNDVYNTLGYRYNDVLSSTIKPLVFSLTVAQKVIDEEESVSYDSVVKKSARNIRQLGMKCLSDLFKILGESFQWDDYISLIYEEIIKPRLGKFTEENLQQTSSLMRLMTSWIELPNLIKFLYIDDFAPVEAIISLVTNTHVKESVVSIVLDFSISALSKRGIDDDNYFTLLALLVDTLLKFLPNILDITTSREINSKAINILLLLIEGDYISENSTRASLIESLTKALDKPPNQVESKDKVFILLSLSSLIDSYDCSFDDIRLLFQACSKSFRVYSDRNVRETLVKVFISMGNRFVELEQVSKLLEGINAYSDKRIEEPDFERRLAGFKEINENLYSNLTTVQWLPIIYCALYFINDELELAIRTNATYTLNRFIDCFSGMDNSDLAQSHIHMFKDVILPHLRIGLRKSTEVVQTEYISVLSHAVECAKYFSELDDMKVLLFNNDEEANFFNNVNHIQLHRRQRAIKRVAEYRNKLSENSISHYILPIIEHYSFCLDEKLRNITNETIDTIGALARCMSWNQYKALLRRYISGMKNSKEELLKDNVNLVVAVSKSLLASIKSRRNNLSEDVMRDLPKSQDEINKYITQELFPILMKTLSLRNDDTIVSRIPLSEAMVSLVMCVSEELIESELPGILTSTCQVMRSRSEELRDTVRKALSKISIILGAKYFKFILKELKGALSRGSQIHVLSFTVHSLLVTISEVLEHGDLDESVQLIIDIIMEDIFGAAGQEKDAEGYTSKMKEVKFKKSFDSGELLCTNISLKSFSYLVEPVKLLLQENVSLKTQNKLDELLRRYALGLNRNDESSSQDVLVLSYELHKQSERLLNERSGHVKTVSSSEDNFLVKLNAKPLKTQTEHSQYIFTLQKFAFELLRTSISRHETLLTTENLEGFVPLLESGLQSDNEGVVIACLRTLTLIIRLPFSEQIDGLFKACARKSLNMIKDCPSTNSELCQACLKFLSAIIRHKPEISLKDTAISYILVRLQPDLEEPNRQGLAFNFLKSVVSQHIMLPEVYDTMDKVSKIMVVNHAKEIRDMSRSVYFQFLMEYDQGRGRLEKQFKFLVNNLGYATQAGRQSVMELIHLIIVKAGLELLNKLSTSFFIGLSNVMISDDSAKCREMATTLISNIFKKLGSKNLSNIEKYCFAWLNQSSNELLKRCGLSIYKIYIAEFGFGENKTLDQLALQNILEILSASKNSEDHDTDVEWELVYSSLSVFSTICSKLKTDVFRSQYEQVWKSILNSLLFPHSWVRLISSRLAGILLSNLDSSEFTFSDYDIQTIAYRLLHQLGAPSISQELGTQITKNLVLLTMRWESRQVLYQYKSSSDTDVGESTKYKYATDYLVARVCSIIRQENNYKDSFVSKKSSVQFAAMLVQVLSLSKLPDASEQILLALYNLTELNPNNSEEESELVNLSMECMQMIEKKLGTSEYTNIYTKVKQAINLRRRERKTKRAQMAVTAPDIAARRKMKKHERSRDKRKHEKDDNGYYRSKKSRFA